MARKYNITVTQACLMLATNCVLLVAALARVAGLLVLLFFTWLVTDVRRSVSQFTSLFTRKK